MVKLVDTLSSGGSALGRGGSNPLMRTVVNVNTIQNSLITNLSHGPSGRLNHSFVLKLIGGEIGGKHVPNVEDC